MQPSVVKVWNVVNEDEARTIDNNARADKKITASLNADAERRQRAEDSAGYNGSFSSYEDQFAEGIDAEQLEMLTADQNVYGDEFDGNMEGMEGAEGMEGMDGMEMPKAPPPPMPAEPPQPAFDEAQIEQILSDARSQADGILSEARQQAAQLAESAHNEGFNAGYTEGLQQAEQEMAERIDAAMQERREELDNEYQKIVDELEPEMVDTLTRIYEHVLGVEVASMRGIILHLLKTTLSRIDPGESFLIHVSPDDYDDVADERESLQAVITSPSSTFDIVEDPLLNRNECMIETDGGIFDCSLGVEMEELTKKLKLLAYDRRRN